MTKNRYPRIGLLGPFGLGNLGDAATQDAAIRGIRTVCPDAQIIGVSLDPSDTSVRHGIQAYPLRCSSRARGVSRVLAEIRFLGQTAIRLLSMDVLIVSGGGQLDDVWGGARGQPYTLFIWALLARLTRTRLFFVSVGAGPILSPKSALLLKTAVLLAQYRSYRDAASRDLIRALGVKEPGAVVPDLAHARTEKSQRIRRGVERAPIVGIGPMPHRDPWMSPRPGPDPALYDAYMAKLCATTEWLLREKGFSVVLYVGEFNHDSKTINDLLALLAKRGISPREGELSCPQISNVQELISCLQGIDIAIASRFHGVLLPISIGIPTLALSYHQKVTELMKDLALDEYLLDIDKCGAAEIRDKFDQLWENGAAVSDCLCTKISAYRMRIARQWSDILSDSRSL